MTDQARDRVRAFVKGKCQAADAVVLLDCDPLFSSGRIDSLAAVELMLFLEGNFDLDSSAPDFDPALLDSIDEIMLLIAV